MYPINCTKDIPEIQYKRPPPTFVEKFGFSCILIHNEASFT
jgi:hypothetical protein